MGVIARPLPIRPMPWRLIALVALIGLLGRGRRLSTSARGARVPPPFGLAAQRRRSSSARPTATSSTVDPATGRTTPLITGPTVDGGPFFSPDGLRFVFDRGTSADRAPLRRSGSPTPTGRMPMSSFPAGPRRRLVRLVADRRPSAPHHADRRWQGHDRRSSTSPTGTATDLPFRSGRRRPRRGAEPRPVRRQTDDGQDNGASTGTSGSSTPTGRARGPIPVSPYAINEPTLSPDGTKLAYATWEPTASRAGSASSTSTPAATRPSRPTISTAPSGRIRGSRRTARTCSSTGSRRAPTPAGRDPRHRLAAAARPRWADTENPPADAICSPDGTESSPRIANAGRHGCSMPTARRTAAPFARDQRSDLAAPGPLTALRRDHDGPARGGYWSAFASAASIAAARSAAATPRGSLPFGQ